MYTNHVLILCMVGCASESPEGPDPCAGAPVEVAGSAQVGLGSFFAPVADGEEVGITYGIQGLRMFVVSARVRGIDIGADHIGGIDFSAYDRAGNLISFANGCRTREFFDNEPVGAWELETPYFLMLLPEARIHGAMVTIRLVVRGHDGQQAVDERTILGRESGH